MATKPPTAQKPSELAPAEIRRIREKIGLSQVEAGELLGGGPRAFTKYEAGTIKPAASVLNLLRLLDANPSTIITLSGGKITPIERDSTRPHEVTGKHVAALSPRKLALLMRRLLDAEALTGDLPMDGIHVAAIITASDGGEDARIEWKGGPARTKFLPGRLSQFQLKAGEISPAEAGADVLTKTGEVQPMVREALERGGTYVMVCSNSYANKRIKARADRVHRSLAGAGLAVAADRVQFRDADQIASWVNVHPPVAAWTLQQTQPGLVGPFKDWSHWAGRFDTSPWITDPRLIKFREKLRTQVGKPRGVARVVGLSGVGKSRLVHEALGPTAEEESATPRLCDLVLYAVESEVGSVAVKDIVLNLADSGFRVVVIVDRCPADSHQDLVGMVKRASSRVSLITIDHEVPPPGGLDPDTLLVELADDSVIEGMIRQIAPDLPSDDHRRLLWFARGFPQMAHLLGQAWLKHASVAAATDDELFDRIILGHKPSDSALLKEAGMLLGAFRLLGVSAPFEDLEQVNAFSRGRSADDLRAALDELQQRGIVQQHGRLVSLQPKPLAMALAERQWRQWGQARWDSILVGGLPETLRERAADQLAMLNDRRIAMNVARHVARLGGPLASIEALCAKANTHVVTALSAIDAEAVVALLEHILQPLSVEEQKRICGKARRNLVRALERVCFLTPAFERGALLMLDLAVAENESWGNNATGQFKALFPVLLSNTEAPAGPRLQLLDDLIKEDDPLRMPIVVEALIEAANSHSHSRAVGPEIHGSRPALVPWQPKYWQDAWDYIISAMDRLCTLALRNDALGAQARVGMAHEFRTLVSAGLLDRVEGWVSAIRAVHPYWPEALNALGDVLQYDIDDLKPGEEARVRKVIADLSPQDIAGRVRFIVTEMPWDYPVDEKLDLEERGRRQVSEVEALALDLLKRPEELAQVLTDLSAGTQRMALQFGIAIGEHAAQPREWEEPMKAAVASVDAKNRNFDLLAGYYTGIAARKPSVVDAFKREAATSPLFASAVPIVCMRIGIAPSDVTLVVEGLKTRHIAPHSVAYWAYGDVLGPVPAAVVAPLLDQLFAMDSEAYSVALDLMGMFVHGRAGRLEELRPQLRLAVKNIGKRPKRRGSQMDAHHFQEMIGWLLKQGRDDTDARAVATDLAKYLADDPDGNGSDLVKPLLKPLLTTFAPIVWPLLGNAIANDRAKAWGMELALGDRVSFADEETPAILHVPEDILFAWCHAHPDVGPAFVAAIAPVLTSKDPKKPTRHFHPLVKRLLDEFGDCDDVRRGLYRNMHTFGWSGSRTTYYARYVEPLRSLENHSIGAVRRWAQVMLTQMRKNFDSAKIEDDEQTAQWDA